MKLPKYSIGIGDRFGRQGKAQLAALVEAKARGVSVAPVWNKSHREHTTIGSAPGDVRAEADAAVRACRWTDPYFVDADHVAMGNVDLFVASSDFFTLDVADFTGKAADQGEVTAFVEKYSRYVGSLEVPGIEEALEVSENQIRAIASRFLSAIEEAGKIYRHVEAAKGAENFVTEVSMDETLRPQTPVEMFFILAAIAEHGIPAQTIAPKFSGRFNKGVDYVGDAGQFAKEFEQDVAVIRLAVRQFHLPANLKLSVHSGSDKFSIYGSMRESLARFDAGVHLKTAGTTWLEEVAGLALGGGLAVAKEIYAKALLRLDELAAPYATVIDIDMASLPSSESVQRWDGRRFAAALKHDASCEAYNPHFRQVLHVAYKVAAEMGDRYLQALADNEATVARNVTSNIYDRHIVPIFMGG
ncbi:MAG: hypothetical protein ISS78_09510 [Phycisphaerae bacterium]|nr:hypothetical protein [Phycisphaerae bacterium]